MEPGCLTRNTMVWNTCISYHMRNLTTHFSPLHMYSLHLCIIRTSLLVLYTIFPPCHVFVNKVWLILVVVKLLVLLICLTVTVRWTVTKDRQIQMNAEVVRMQMNTDWSKQEEVKLTARSCKWGLCREVWARLQNKRKIKYRIFLA